MFRSGLDDGALAHLYGKRGDEAVDRPIGIGVVQGPQRGGGENRGDRLGVRRHLAGDELELGRLVAEHHQICAFGYLTIGCERLTPNLGGQRLGAIGDGIGHEQRTVPPTRERTRHIPCADQSNIHEASRLPIVIASTRS